MNTIKEWYIIIVDGQPEGPFGIDDLKNDQRITPDTLVWKQGFDNWIPIRTVPELQEIFKETGEVQPPEEPIDLLKKRFPLGDEDETLAIQQDPFQMFTLLLVILIILFYFIYQIYGPR